MTGKEPNKDNDRLARLYREQGDIEPGPGVDQRIRARAKADARLSGLPRPAHWLGGVAVAASLFVVVSIVTNIQPPEADLPATQSTRTNDEERAPEADAPEVGSAESADSAPRPLRVVEQRAEPEGLEEKAGPEAEALEESSSPDSSAPVSDTMLQRRTRWSAADDAAETARKQYESLGSSRQSGKDRAEARELLQSTDNVELELLGEDVAASQRALWLIDRLIFVGNEERARAEVEAFREQFPEQEIPQNLLERLEELEAGDAGRE